MALGVGIEANHGWVRKRPDGTRANCGGPTLCAVCRLEQHELDDLMAQVGLADLKSGDAVLFDVGHCGRCGERHGEMVFARLSRPIQSVHAVAYTHWAQCPRTGEPLVATLLMNTLSGEDRV